jgi:ribosomal-protein-alanine N-acetyltransferase
VSPAPAPGAPDVPTVRDMSEADLPMVVWLEDTVLEQGRPVAVWARLLADPARRAWVAEAPPGRVAGFIAVAAAADEVEIEQFAVAPEARRKGLGAALLDRALAWAKGEGVAVCHLEVRRRARPARALYARFGFAQVGVRAGYYRSPPDDALRLARSL